MATINVRVHGHAGIEPITVVNQRQFASDSVMHLSQPYEFAQTIPLTIGGAAASSVASSQSPDRATVCRVEVPDGQGIRYEINPPGRTAVAGVNSPRLSGVDVFKWGVGYTISMIELSSVP